MRQWHHHRERRFHRPQEALGRGYEDFDVIPPALHSASTAVRQPAPESAPIEIESALTSEIEKVQRTSVNGIQICAMVLFLLVAALSAQSVLIWYCLILVLLYQLVRRW